MMMPPTRLGPYEIGKPIGKGGMGAVYEASDVNSGQRVAVKALNPHLALAEGFRERFEAEIESLKTLRHEGIVSLYGYGEQDGILFYSMELIDGISLEDELRAGRRFQWREVANIAIQLCLALKHAHDHGIVHRDIKPANILLTRDERVKLADFGIARLFGATQLTSVGGVLGTADYMSPEQADGSPITARCDQYSLGGVMYALLVGRPPFRAQHLPEMLQLQRFAKPEPVRRFAPNTPEQLDKVVLQLLSKDPADRFPNTLVLARHLQAMTRALSPPAMDSPAPAETPVSDQDIDQSLAEAVTRTDVAGEEPAGDVVAGKSSRPVPPEEAATLASEQLPGRTPDDIRISLSLPSLVGQTDTGPGDLAAGTARFTSIEEERARQQKQLERSWLSAVPQLVGLATALAVLAAIAFYLSRPLTADALYNRIATRAEADDPDSLRNAEREIHQFLERFPDDPRASELQLYSRQLELDRLERSLQLRARRNGALDLALLPVESLYLQATSAVQTSPEQAAVMLQSLIDLYGADAAVDSAGSQTIAKQDDQLARQAACVDLARRSLERLRADLVKQRSRQLASVQERLTAAGKISDQHPAEAAAIYRAIVNLHQNDAWADDVVAEARHRLDEIQTRRQGDKETGRQGER
jgi:serine/threonine protein kinase